MASRSRAPARRAGAASIGAILLLAGCAGRPTPGADFRSPKGFRLSLPGQDWRVVDDSRADLELRHRSAAAGIVVNASCDARHANRPIDALTREILAGFADREVRARGAAPVAGREAAQLVVDGRGNAPGERVRVELVVVKGDRCVYDLVYAAALDDFARGQGDFQRVVWTLSLD